MIITTMIIDIYIYIYTYTRIVIDGMLYAEVGRAAPPSPRARGAETAQGPWSA